MCWASPRSLRSPLYTNSISALDIELLACQSLNSHSCLCQSAPTPLADVSCSSQLLRNFHIHDLTVALTRLLNPILTAWACPSFSHLHKSVETNHSALAHDQKAFLSCRVCYYYFSANSNPTRLSGLSSVVFSTTKYHPWVVWPTAYKHSEVRDDALPFLCIPAQSHHHSRRSTVICWIKDALNRAEIPSLASQKLLFFSFFLLLIQPHPNHLW